MDVKSVSLNGYIDEEVFVSQSPSFLRIINFKIMYTSLRKLFMNLNECQENGMRDIETSFLNKSLRKEKLIKPFLLKKILS